MSFTLFAVPDQRFTGGYSPKGWDVKLLLWPIFPKNYMKMKKMWTKRGDHIPSTVN